MYIIRIGYYKYVKKKRLSKNALFPLIRLIRNENTNIIIFFLYVHYIHIRKHITSSIHYTYLHKHYILWIGGRTIFHSLSYFIFYYRQTTKRRKYSFYRTRVISTLNVVYAHATCDTATVIFLLLLYYETSNEIIKHILTVDDIC